MSNLSDYDYNSSPVPPYIASITNRTIVFESELVDVAVAGDVNSTAFYFRMPRYFDKVDLLQKEIRIKYQNAKNECAYSSDTYITEIDDDTFQFRWSLGSGILSQQGTVTFLIEFREIDDGGNAIYIWQTKPTSFCVESGIVVLSDASLPDYTTEKEFNDTHDNQTTYNQISDSNDPILISNRKILMPVIQDIVVSKDTCSQVISFKMPRFIDGVDLSEKTICIKYLNANGQGDRCSIMNLTSDNTEITFGWLIDGKVTVKSGYVDFAIEILGYNEKNEFYVWQTSPAKLVIEKGIDVDSIIEEPSPSWIQSWQIEADNVLKEAKAEAARSEAAYTQCLYEVADLRAYLGYYGDDVAGLQVDFVNNTFTRLAGAKNLSAGADFDKFSMFGQRKRCNVADDGTIVAYYGDAAYAEDGSMGQVMVYQPKFYYMTVPVLYEKQETGLGYHLRKANYYVSDKPLPGFRLHPAFFDGDGNEVNYILLSAFEGSIFDTDGGEDGGGAYLFWDEQAATFTTDKFCSISGVKPASGATQNLTRLNIEQMAKNRGIGWHSENIKSTSANQYLMIIEMGALNMQTAIGKGIVSITDNSAYNCSSLTGSTSVLGNSTGQATETINEIGGVQTVYTTGGKLAVTYRGMENPWGNLWKFVCGINIWGDGTMNGGQPFICSDFNFAESKKTDNYEGAGFYLCNANGYIKAFGYSQKYDWLFLPSEIGGTSSLPVGDYAYVASNLNGYRIARLGGYWSIGDDVGAFCWRVNDGVSTHNRALGGRLVYIPSTTV